MIRFRVFAFILLFTAALAHAQTPLQLEADFQQKLQGQYLTLRTPRAGNKLHFGVDGEPLGKTQSGLRSIDGMLRVQSVRAKSAALVIRGERMLVTYDRKTGLLVADTVKLPLELTIDMPAVTVANIDVILNKVFFSSQELQSRTCSDTEKQAFTLWLDDNVGRSKKPKIAPADAQQITTCFPTGDRVYTLNAGIKGPIPSMMGHIDRSALRARAQDSAIFVLAISASGQVLDAILLGGYDASVTYQTLAGLREWKFNPARRDGNPIPSLTRMLFDFQSAF